MHFGQVTGITFSLNIVLKYLNRNPQKFCRVLDFARDMRPDGRVALVERRRETVMPVIDNVFVGVAWEGWATHVNFNGVQPSLVNQISDPANMLVPFRVHLYGEVLELFVQ